MLIFSVLFVISDLTVAAPAHMNLDDVYNLSKLSLIKKMYSDLNLLGYMTV